ncbi:MAG: acetylornithine/succinylornithine family transaminase [Clostridia bacterium]|nr:acetylornithine/succinylornithine family transaminase [Clostridia bacterium]
MIQNFKELDKEYVANTYGRFDLLIERGKGSLVYDETGKEYIDLSTGIAVNTFGVCDDGVKNAVLAQLDKVQHTSNLYYSEPCILLAQTLCERTGAKKVFFGNSGAEANECAIKVARKWADDKKGFGHSKIITLQNSFHGRTVTTLSATGQDVFHQHFHPFTGGFVHVAVGDLAAVETEMKTGEVAAVFVELVQGEGGVMPLEKEFVQGLVSLCEKYDALFMVDEVQTGNGRSGALYAYQKFGVTPDVVTTAKGLGGGLPLGATLLFEKVQGVLDVGSHGSTFGGNPVACAAALSVLSRIDDVLLKEVEEKSELIFSSLSGAKGVKSVSGMGLMIGVETEKPVGEVLAACMEKGILPIKAKNKLRLLPALNIEKELLEKALNVLKECL